LQQLYTYGIIILLRCLSLFGEVKIVKGSLYRWLSTSGTVAHVGLCSESIRIISEGDLAEYQHRYNQYKSVSRGHADNRKRRKSSARSQPIQDSWLVGEVRNNNIYQCWLPLQLNDIIQVLKCTKSIKKKKKKTRLVRRLTCACAEKNLLLIT